MKRENFTNRRAVIMALAGSAIGLGNIWRFPYIVGQYGGAAFILVYLCCSFLLSLPVMMSESIIGRRTCQNTMGSIESLTQGRGWKCAGLLAVITPVVILSYYSVVGGWSVDYLLKSLTFSFSSVNADAVPAMFSDFSASAVKPILCHALFLFLTAGIIFVGVKSGIERFSKISVPVLFVLIVLIAAYSMTLPGAEEGVRYLVRPDFSKLTPSALSAALGQSFFSLSLGIGCILTYSSYVRKDENLMAMGSFTTVFDISFAILAGFAIMPAVFAAGIAPSGGPGLVFETLPYIFAKMGAAAPVLSGVVAIMFFLAVLVSALTSSVSLMEAIVAYFVEEKGFTRHRATILIFSIAFAAGALCSLSFGPLSGIRFFGQNFFSFLDKVASDYLMTFGALVFTIVAGWKMKKDAVKEEFTNNGKKPLNVRLFPSVYFLIKFVAPVFIIAIFILGLLGL